MTKLPDWVRRGIRTFIQAFIGIFAGLALPWLNDVVTWASHHNGNAFPAWSVIGKACVAGVGAGLVALISGVQNGLEDHTKFPALLKAPASGGVAPAPDPVDARLGAQADPAQPPAGGGPPLEDVEPDPYDPANQV